MNVKKKFNFFDFFIIAIVALILVGIVWFMGRNDTDTGVQNRIQYVVEMQNLTEDKFSSIQIGDKVLDSVGKSEIGVVSAIDKVPYTVSIYNTVSGKLESVEMEGRYSLLLTIEAYADVTEEAINVGSYRVAVGKGISVQSKNYVGTGYCLSVDVVEE